MDIISTENIYDIVVVGAGPHSLGFLARLFEPRPASLYTEAELTRLSFLRKLAGRNACASHRRQSELRVAVIDEHGSAWLLQWNKLFEALEIKHLRSPMFFHADPGDVDGLVAYSHSQGRDKENVEMRGVVGREFSKHKQKYKMGKRQIVGHHVDERARQDYFRPSTSLFCSFCGTLVDRYALNQAVRQGKVIDMDYMHIHEQHVGRSAKPLFSVAIENQDTIYSHALVVSAGLATFPNLPAVLPASLRTTAWCHSSDLMNKPLPQVGSLLVIGGGLTSAQIVDLAIARNVSKIHLVCRSPLQTKHLDYDLHWVSKYGNVFKMAFHQSDSFDERLQTLKEGKNGGSMPAANAKAIKDYGKQGRLACHMETDVVEALYDGKWQVKLSHKSGKGTIDSLQVDYIVAATGSSPAFNKLPFMQTLQRKYPISTTGGLPHITEDLQYNPDLPCFFAGGYAALQLGPGAFNLSGTREGGDRIVKRLEELFTLSGQQESEVSAVELLAGNHGNYFQALEVEV